MSQLRSFRRRNFVLAFTLSLVATAAIMHLCISRDQRNNEQAIPGTYHDLVEEMLRDVDGHPTPSSSREYVFHPNYPRLIQLGKRVVPLAIADLRADKDYALDVLDDLLPEIDFGRLYGDEHYKWVTERHRAYWLRWWDEHGSKKDWSTP